ncbi:hypothetical protein B296_00027189 [Ensete ventricosum]|uniref:Uncharacterized protein n=1 Tax=Ensete ventricosum TaxID=4639 RepID=A0A427ADF8_ENSVE|nr:hypothetical protein B296_00027189 [Ensete ventricosum]
MVTDANPIQETTESPGHPSVAPSPLEWSCVGELNGDHQGAQAMSTMKIEESLSYPVCQEDFEIDVEARTMPRKHKFLTNCVLPWLTLHSSYPIYRF